MSNLKKGYEVYVMIQAQGSAFAFEIGVMGEDFTQPLKQSLKTAENDSFGFLNISKINSGLINGTANAFIYRLGDFVAFIRETIYESYSKEKVRFIFQGEIVNTNQLVDEFGCVYEILSVNSNLYELFF